MAGRPGCDSGSEERDASPGTCIVFLTCGWSIDPYQHVAIKVSL